MTKLIPDEVKTAAKRGFIRTTAQGYEGVLAAGISANIVVGLIRGEADMLVIGVTAAVALIAPPLAGLRSYLSITRKGIPEDYQPVTARHAAE